MKMCMGANVKATDNLEKVKCQKCIHLARGRGADDDNIKEWHNNPKMPCKLYKAIAIGAAL